MSQTLVPFIPEDAPFTPAQRAWLNGFVAGLYSYAPAPAAEAPQALRLAVLYGSQTGTAEGLARRLAKELKAAGHTVSMSSLEGYVPATLAAETYALFIVSTYGEGEAPDAAQPFYQQLCVEHFPLLGGLSYAVLALGDSHYEHFCQFGKELDAKLETLGGTRILPRVDSDVDVDAPFTGWKDAAVKKLRELASPPGMPASGEAVAATGETPAPGATAGHAAGPAHTRDNPYLSPLAEKRALTHPSSSKLTIHLDFAIEDSAIQYEAGDACGVVPQNHPRLVDAVLASLPFSGSEMVEIPRAGSMTLHEALLRRFAISRLSRKIISQYAAAAQCTKLTALLAPENQTDLEQYLHGRDLVDLLRECPDALQTPGDLVKMLSLLTPRLYSISSSPVAHPGRVHTTVSVVRWRAHDRDRGGVCSTLLADRIEIGDRLPIYIQANKKFRLPQDPKVPVIMIGPGTGIAPFRAFLHERRAIGATGKNWLFFGERSASTDFLYREELEGMQADGHLSRLDTAFSRDQEQKIYVQDLMMQNGQQLWGWLEEGAFLYVCGDASKMAKDVDRTLRRIIETQGKMPEEAAESYVQALKDNKRYQRDIY
ncbi:sulfite reductase subunit alpha [Paracidobacterium acidisoli]|uniref:assimilatory sulfite reductase (NADPH) n=1 Tax=Paracidobacterium acidisoli TaxID=2303751 RepID=A0A372IV09_9BACT|nr:sulfite reductase subunit alpha [Paracidobacterium acidisoli]MBT9330093.1 sulfite reductase subunit alpha [Paracidobacterium acidisoli]